MRLARYLRTEHRRPEQPGYSFLMHSSLILLNKYVVKIGLKASLLDQDRYLVAIACYFISAKTNSQFIRSKELLEYYFLNRPMGSDQPNSAAAMLNSPAYASNNNLL